MSGIFKLGVLVLYILTTAESCVRKPAKVAVACPGDKRVVADRKANTAVVRWNRVEFRTDSTHPIRGIYQTIPIYGASANVQRNFEEGSHYVEYKAVDEGGRFSSCSFKVHVTVIKCPAMHNPEYGYITCDAGNVFGSQCAVSCIPGYSVKGLAEITCLNNGSWTAPKPECIALACPDPGTPIHGDRYCNSITHAVGSFCTFNCNRGYHQVGLSKMICSALNNGTVWTEKIPTCQAITPPRADACPHDINETTGLSAIEIHKPQVRFITSRGDPAPFVCSHFSSRDRYLFTVGNHTVTCTAYDPFYGNDATASCTFQVIVKANPCRQLAKPRNGKLICSRSEGASVSSVYDTSCELYCNDSYILPKENGEETRRFYCDSSGSWKPHHYVPSCVKPKRPQELKLPSEIYYNSTNCTNHLNTIRSRFQSAVQTTIRNQNNCARNPGDCIVDTVVTSCRRQNRRAKPFIQRHSNNRQPRWISEATYQLRQQNPSGFLPSPSQEADLKETKYQELGSQYIVSIQFQYGTRIPEIGGQWPDEYHNALNRLYGMYDYFERRVNLGYFRLDSWIEGVTMAEVLDSLTFAKDLALCDLGYSYDDETLFCVPCGPGNYFDLSNGRCQLCRIGHYQTQEAKLNCDKCPTGTTSLDLGASRQDQCIQINECESSPCQNGGICIDKMASYECGCKQGFAGDTCTERVYNCSSHDCQNGGTCVPGNDDRYTCLCRPAYSGDFCQLHSIHGSWGSWSEFTGCSGSCEGGTQRRERLCNSPPPGNGGDPCEGAAVQERVCNDFTCPKCKELRRPYGGRMNCTRHGDVFTSCRISCNPGYAFSDPVLSVYSCGRNTSYLWPHESPDNPRCILPSCTRVSEPVKESFIVEGRLTASECTPRARLVLRNELKKRSVEFTRGLHCLRDGFCELQTPEVGECLDLQGRQRRSTGDHQDTDLTFKVSLIYKRDIWNPVPRLANQAMEEISKVNIKVLHEIKERNMNLKMNGVTAVIKSSSVSAVTSPVCDKGMVPCVEEYCCVECSQGSYYDEDSGSCTLCAIGHYQPFPKQLSCIQCPKNHTTYGRGAIFDIECYSGNESPPSMPENYTSYLAQIEHHSTSTSTMNFAAPIIVLCLNFMAPYLVIVDLSLLKDN